MPKTTREIRCDLIMWNPDEKDYNILKPNKRWYTEKEVDKIVENCMSAKIGIEEFIKTGIIRCPKCRKPFIKTDAYSWKPSCNCLKDLRLNIG